MGLGENERVERKAKVGVLCGVVTCTYGVQDSDNTFLKHWGRFGHLVPILGNQKGALLSIHWYIQGKKKKKGHGIGIEYVFNVRVL